MKTTWLYSFLVWIEIIVSDSDYLFIEKLRNYTFMVENLFPGIFYKGFFFFFFLIFFYKGVTVRFVNNDGSSVVLVL